MSGYPNTDPDGMGWNPPSSRGDNTMIHNFETYLKEYTHKVISASEDQNHSLPTFVELATMEQRIIDHVESIRNMVVTATIKAEDATAENGRLRLALEQIRQPTAAWSNDRSVYLTRLIDEVIRIADEALRGDK